MRIDAFGPRTWLLATLAGWALLVWILALFGMGGQVRPLPDDPSLVTALPKLSAAAPNRLGPLSHYAEIAARPVFYPARTPQPFFVSGQGEGEAAQVFDYVLSSILITPGLQMAILSPAQGGGEGIRLKVGEAPDNAPAWRVVEIHPRSVLIQGPEGPRTLQLRVFDGTGGQPVSAAPLPAGSAGVPVALPTGPGGTAPPMATPSRPSSTSSGVPAPAPTPAAMQSIPPTEPQTTEQQMEAIRKRIEARREQLRQQGESTPPQNKTK